MPNKDVTVAVPPERTAPWWAVGVLIAAALVEIVVSGIMPSVAVDVVSMITVYGIPVAFLACFGWQAYDWRGRRAAVSNALTEAVGSRVTPVEAGEYIHAVEAIRTHLSVRDQRDPPVDGLVPLRSRPDSRIRVAWQPPGFVATLEHVV